MECVCVCVRRACVYMCVRERVDMGPPRDIVHGCVLDDFMEKRRETKKTVDKKQKK